MDFRYTVAIIKLMKHSKWLNKIIKIMNTQLPKALKYNAIPMQFTIDVYITKSL